MAQVPLQSLGAETLRLVADLGAPLMVGLRRLASHCRRQAPRMRPSRWAIAGAAAIFAVLLGGAAGAVLLYSIGADRSVEMQGAGATGEPLRSGPVKIIDAAPRGESCEEQVWPYIEQRCLRRAAASSPPPAAPPPGPVAATPPLPTPAIEPTVEIASPAALPPPPPPAPVDVAESPAATEPRRGEGSGTAVLAGAAAGAAAIQTARPERRAERRRSGRRSARRQSFPFPIFGLRF